MPAPSNHLLMHPMPGQRAKWKVQTPMNTPIDNNIVSDMIGAVELTYNIQPHTPSEYQLFSTVQLDDVHMIFKEREFKYGQGKEIVAFADGPKSVSGKDMKYVKFFYIYDNKPDQVKPNAKTYTFSLTKARDFGNDKIGEGYNKVDAKNPVDQRQAMIEFARIFPARVNPFINNDLDLKSIETST